MTDRIASLRIREGILFLTAYALCIPAANWLILNVGTACIDNGPCVIPVAPGLNAPSGVLMIGLALVLRDLVQRRLGLTWTLAAIIFGAALSAAFAPPSLVFASTVAFLLSEFADLLVYTPLQRRRLLLAVVASSIVGLIVDSVIFLYLAFASLDYLLGQIIGKAWMVAAAIPFVLLLRRRDARIGMAPA